MKFQKFSALRTKNLMIKRVKNLILIIWRFWYNGPCSWTLNMTMVAPSGNWQNLMDSPWGLLAYALVPLHSLWSAPGWPGASDPKLQTVQNNRSLSKGELAHTIIYMYTLSRVNYSSSSNCTTANHKSFMITISSTGLNTVIPIIWYSVQKHLA